MNEYTLVGFWVACLTLAGLVAEAVARLDRPWSRPALVLYFTIGMWYHADFVYNDPAEFQRDFSVEVLNDAWYEVCGFLICFRLWLEVTVPYAMRGFVRAAPPPARAMAAEQDRVLKAVGGVWAGLAGVALVRMDGDVLSLICPPLSDAGHPWGRPGVGGPLDFLVSAAESTHLALCGLFGVFVAIGVHPRTRWAAAGLFASSSGLFLFGRARNRMLMIVLPGVLAYILVTRVSWVRKAAVAGGVFVALFLWFIVVINQRNSNFADLASGQTLFDAKQIEESRHHGLDMYRELCFINVFIENGKYEVNYGGRYRDELAMVIPRAVWPGKPFIGYDYAIARGFGNPSADGGVNATIATGMIGQGLVNFGRLFGPVAAAGLAALWVAILARQWADRDRTPRLILFLIGLGLTVNLGRDITFQILFTFVFATVGVIAYERYGGRAA